MNRRHTTSAGLLFLLLLATILVLRRADVSRRAAADSPPQAAKSPRLDELSDSQPLLNAWSFPGAKITGRLNAKGAVAWVRGRASPQPSAYARELTTPAPLEEIWRFYARRMGIGSGAADYCRSGYWGISGPGGTGQIVTAVRPGVGVETFLLVADRYALSGFVVRSDADKISHITLDLSPR